MNTIQWLKLGKLLETKLIFNYKENENLKNLLLILKVNFQLSIWTQRKLHNHMSLLANSSKYLSFVLFDNINVTTWQYLRYNTNYTHTQACTHVHIHEQRHDRKRKETSTLQNKLCITFEVNVSILNEILADLTYQFIKRIILHHHVGFIPCL